MLRINDLDSFISKVTSKIKNVTIKTYSVIIKNAIIENDSSINRISSPKVIISVRKKLITFTKETFFIKEISFNETSRVVVMNEYRSSHIDVKNVIVFAFLKMKKVYDARYQFIFFKIRNLINVLFHKDYKVSIITSKKIRSQLIKSFKIFERIKRLIYRLKLFINIKIYDVIFIAHMKPIIDFIKDSYQRRRLLISIIVIDDEKKYKIEKLIKKRIIKRERE